MTVGSAAYLRDQFLLASLLPFVLGRTWINSNRCCHLSRLFSASTSSQIVITTTVIFFFYPANMKIWFSGRDRLLLRFHITSLIARCCCQCRLLTQVCSVWLVFAVNAYSIDYTLPRTLFPPQFHARYDSWNTYDVCHVPQDLSKIPCLVCTGRLHVAARGNWASTPIIPIFPRYYFPSPIWLLACFSLHVFVELLTTYHFRCFFSLFCTRASLVNTSNGNTT